MRTPRVLALGMTAVLMVAACGGATPTPTAAPATGAPPTEAATEAAKAPIKIGSDNFYESKLVAEIYAQVLEHAGYTVERKFGLGSRQERIPVMDAGQIDLVPEYVGSGLGFYDKTKITGDGQKVLPTAEAIAALVDEATPPDVKRARTREGQLQVELAQLNYMLPRLTGKGAEMSRLGAGIGARLSCPRRFAQSAILAPDEC